MNTELLYTFLSEDGDAHVRQKLLNAIREQRATGNRLIQEFNFNRFNILLDFDAKQASLRDDLTVGPEGEHKLGLDEFEKALQEG